MLMTTNSPKSDSLDLMDQLVRIASDSGLILFVGAGINAKTLPQWNDLLDELLEEAILKAGLEDSRVATHATDLKTWCDHQFDVCAKASILKQLLGDRNYLLSIQDALFRKAPGAEVSVRNYCENKSKHGSNQLNPDYHLLWTVAELASLPFVRGIATFNFDSLLEAAILGYGDRHPIAYFGDTFAPEGGSGDGKALPVFHLHGMLSSPDTLMRRRNESIVFSYDEYLDKNADPLSWESSTPIHLLRNFTTLWIGTSLRDWNMLRLLHAANSSRAQFNSYCIQSLEEVRGDAPEDLKRSAMRFQATLYQSVGLKLIISGSNYASVSDSISEYITTPLRERLAV